MVDWAASRARMVIGFILLSLIAGVFSYTQLPKEGEPDIEIPALFVSVPFQGISAEDSETLLVRPMETELADLDGLKSMTSTAAEGYAGVALEFDFGWDKTKILADLRDAMNRAEAEFPDGFENYSITEINFSEFPIIIVNLTGEVPERLMIQLANDLQDRVESLESVLEAGIAGKRDEMLEVVIDPLRLESYNVTANELISVVQNNNRLIAAGEVRSAQGAFSVKIPSSFDEPSDVYDLPIKTNGEQVITLGDLAEIRLTFEDRTGTARFDGETTVALQVVKRKGFNVIDTANEVRRVVEEARQEWPEELQQAVAVGTSNDQSRNVDSMVRQLEGSVLTAVALVMIVVLAALGPRPAFLVGFAVPTSFLLCFAFLAMMGVSISNIVMFGLILAVGMLVDGAIVVVEYADKRIAEGVGPMQAYVEAAKRMFWPVVSSTATTLCAFLPMLFWPGVPGEFMGMLPVTIIFVLSASLIVALIYLPILGGVMGRWSRFLGRLSDNLRAGFSKPVIAVIIAMAVLVVLFGLRMMITQLYRMDLGLSGGSMLPGVLLIAIGATALSVGFASIKSGQRPTKISGSYQRSPFGRFIQGIAGNPIMPIVTILAIIAGVNAVFSYFGNNNNGVEFFVESEPEQAIIYVLARGNLSIEEKDALVKQAEAIALAHPGVDSVFAFAGDGGLNSDSSGAIPPKDAIGQVQIETIPWEDRAGILELDGDVVLAEIQAELNKIPGIKTEILPLAQGPASAKPVHLRVTGQEWEPLLEATSEVRAKFDSFPGLALVEDTLPLPGIDWQIDVDVERAGRFGADVAVVGAMVQLVTRGILLDTMNVPSSDEEIDIRVRFPEKDRLLSTLNSLRVRTDDGLIPLANFITITPVEKLAEITRDNQRRYFDIKADVVDGGMLLFAMEAEGAPSRPVALLSEAQGEVDYSIGGSDYALLAPWDGVSLEELESILAMGPDAYQLTPLTPDLAISLLSDWLETGPFPAEIGYFWTGDQEDQAESQEFLATAFLGALGLMFIILLAQFNSFYNSLIVLLAVVLSTTGVLIGMLVMDQAFSVIMTGTGIVALAGIVVNNNIVLIDTYQEYSRYMPRIEAVIRTAEARIRPVLLTTVTTMAGLAPMMFGLSINFADGGYTIDSPTSLWWKQLATAVVFGLGIATILTLLLTPALLALRIWIVHYALLLARWGIAKVFGKESEAAKYLMLAAHARSVGKPEIIWEAEETLSSEKHPPKMGLKVAE